MYILADIKSNCKKDSYRNKEDLRIFFFKAIHRDVVLDSLNMAYRHEDSVFDQKYEKQISRARYYKDFELKEIQHITARNS